MNFLAQCLPNGGRIQRAFLCCLVFIAVAFPHGLLAGAENSIDFTEHVRPLLSEYCFECHGPDEGTRAADLRMDLESELRDALNSSDFRERLATKDADLRMPPAESRRQPTEEERELLLRWLDEGGQTKGHWSFQPIVRPPVPREAQDEWCSNAIDAFVLARLKAKQLEPSPEAAIHTIARRISFDLAGLPPSPMEIDLLETGTGSMDGAIFEPLIDQLISDPAYAEQMARPWLEAARYADTDGYQNDRYRYQHAWRDWVLKAYNEKYPFDRFAIEQLAGDMLPDATLWQQVASGFGRNHRINSEDGSIPEEWRVENVADRVDTLGTVFLGLTIGCARCHDHKYDPISQKEYYQLFGYFNSIAEHGVGPNNGNSPPFIKLPAEWPLISSSQDTALDPEPVKLRDARKEAGNGLKRPQAGDPQTVMVMHELAEPRPTYVLERGQYNAPVVDEPLSPSIPGAFNQSTNAPKTRLELARWLVSGDNPLTPRVVVNRIWQQHFGIGLVETSENLGAQGTLPSHPQLLDWLAAELVESGWDIQRIQRLILSSSTYRQSSQRTRELDRRDPNNRLLARGPRQRLDAFQLRDQALQHAGLLVHRTGGPSTKPYMPEKIWSAISNNKYKQDEGEALFRRSVYTYWRRTIPPPTMVSFNAAGREVCSVRGEVTNTPLQALTLMNNITFVEAARAMAERVLKHNPALEDQLRYAFHLCTARRPQANEISQLQRAHAAFLNEFELRPKSATQLLGVGESPRDEGLDSTKHAAMTLVCSLLLNLDETLSKE